MANVSRFDPRADAFGDLVDDLFKGFLVRPMYSEGRGEQAGKVRVDVSERDGAYLVQAELPGVKKEDIQLTIDGAQVTLTAEIKREKETKEGAQEGPNERLLHSERLYGKVSRSFTLPQEIDEENAQAKFTDGVLELTLPKKSAAARKQITIQ
jgi:HSP20 family protein